MNLRRSFRLFVILSWGFLGMAAPAPSGPTVEESATHSSQLEGFLAAVVSAPDSPGKSDWIAYEKLLGEYFQRDSLESNLKNAIALSKLADSVFNPERTDLYLKKLQLIDRLADQNREAAYDVGRFLEQEWERQYGFGLGRRHVDTLKNSTHLGSVIGMTLMMAAVASRSNLRMIPKAFRVFRSLYGIAPGLPVAGAVAGYATGKAINALDGAHRRPAPAQVLQFGEITDQSLVFGDNAWLRDVILTTAGIGATSAALMYTASVVAWLRYAGLAISAVTGEFIIPAIVGLIVAAVFYGIGKLIDYAHYRSLRAEVTAARRKLDAAVRDRDDEGIYRYADELEKAAGAFADLLNQPIAEAIEEFNSDTAEATDDILHQIPGFSARLSEINRRYRVGFVARKWRWFREKLGVEDETVSDGITRPGGREYFHTKDERALEEMLSYQEETSRLRENYLKVLERSGPVFSNLKQKLAEKSRKAIETLSETVREFVRDNRLAYHADYEDYMVRELLAQGDDETLAMMPFTVRSRAEIYRRNFQECVTTRQVAGGDAPVESCAMDFPSYLARLGREKNRKLIEELRRGEVRDHANHVLLQAAAYIEALEKPFLRTQVNNLMTKIQHENLKIWALQPTEATP
ncbi:MAG: hypothetical protein AB7P04_00260 [Bacteriovoracia bacterium]